MRATYSATTCRSVGQRISSISTAELPDADWDALASLGPALNVTVEQLRNHVNRILDSFDPDLPVQDRAAKLCAAVEEKQTGETLSLLVVAEDSLYRWQLLRLARVGDKEPEHRQRVIDDLNELIRHQLAEDGKLYREAKNLLDDFAKTGSHRRVPFFVRFENLRNTVHIFATSWTASPRPVVIRSRNGRTSTLPVSSTQREL